MNDSKSEKDYFDLLKSGMFWEIYPDLTGEWEKDKDEFIKNEQWLTENFRKMKNDLPMGHTLPWPDPQIAPSKVTPILALYLNIGGIDDVQEAFDFAQKTMEKYKNHGWAYIIIPITDGRDSFIESHAVERLDPIELKELEIKILESIKTGE